MNWAYPEMIWASVLAGAAAVLALLVLLRKRRALKRLALVGPLLLVSRWTQTVKAALLAAVGLLLAIVVLGPQWGRAAQETPPISGRDVLIIADVSRSMLAEDVAPNRLDRAKADIKDLAVWLEQRDGYRIGLIAFADHASVLCPLTFDYRCFDEELKRLSLESLRLRGDQGGNDGTQIGTALRRAGKAIDKDQASFTDILLISDGDDLEQDTLDAADELGKAGVRVHTIGVGDPTRASRIPVTGPEGERSWLKYRGEQVRTRLEERVLQEIARRTGGLYLDEGPAFLNLDGTFGALLANQPTRELQMGGQPPAWIHRFEWFLLPALVLLLAEMLVPDGRRKPRAGFGQPRYWRWVRRKEPLAASPPAGSLRDGLPAKVSLAEAADR
jgi:Ca-activated chloride channel family protein